MKIVIYVMDLIGPQNAAIGLAQALRERGHEIHFLVSERCPDRFSTHGFRFHALDDVFAKDGKADKPQHGNENNKLISQRMSEIGMFSDLSTYDKFQQFGKSDFLQRQYESSRHEETQIRHLLQSIQPELIIVNSKVMPPCLITQPHTPFVSIFCANPLCLYGSPKCPPYTSGYPTNKYDKDQWDKYNKMVEDIYYGVAQKYQSMLLEQFNGSPVLPFEMTCRPISPYLNVYQYPEELDYHDIIDIPDHYVRVDAFCRRELESFPLPEEFKAKIAQGAKLIYLSLGTMGSYAIDVMRKLVSTLATTKHLYIISKGSLADEYELADNMIGGAYLPQTNILSIPELSLSIIHGGNNSLTESIYYGKPMIVLPVFYDQNDNAQRVKEKQFGSCLNPFNFDPADLIATIDQVLNDDELRERLQRASKRIQQSRSKVQVCERIEKLVEEGRK